MKLFKQITQNNQERPNNKAIIKAQKRLAGIFQIIISLSRIEVVLIMTVFSR